MYQSIAVIAIMGILCTTNLCVYLSFSSNVPFKKVNGQEIQDNHSIVKQELGAILRCFKEMIEHLQSTMYNVREAVPNQT